MLLLVREHTAGRQQCHTTTATTTQNNRCWGKWGGNEEFLICLLKKLLGGMGLG